MVNNPPAKQETQETWGQSLGQEDILEKEMATMREEGSGWGTHVYLWQIHFDIWQNQYNIVKFKTIKGNTHTHTQATEMNS